MDTTSIELATIYYQNFSNKNTNIIAMKGKIIKEETKIVLTDNYFTKGEDDTNDNKPFNISLPVSSIMVL